MPTIDFIYKIYAYNPTWLAKDKKSFDLNFFKFICISTEKNVKNYFQQLLVNKKVPDNDFNIPEYYYDERDVFRNIENNKIVLKKDIADESVTKIPKYDFFPFVRRIFFTDIMNHIEDLENFNIHWLKAIKSYKETCLKYFQQDNILEIYKEFYSFIKREDIDSEIQYLLKDIETLNMHIKNKT
tara:strand:- start:2820 stop:3371 length:552 start_codon:yes stop_codon:yes gene_type:complete